MAALPLAARFTALLALLVLLVAAVLAAVLSDRLLATRASLQLDRYLFVVDNMRHSLESTLSLGLTMGGQAQQRTAALEAVARDDAMLSIDVFDSDGRILFTTDLAGIRDRVPDNWLDATLSPEARVRGHWTSTDRGVVAIGAPLVNDFGVTAGGIVLRHRSQAQSLSLVATLLEPAVILGLLALAVVLGFGAYCWLLRNERAVAAGVVRLGGRGQNPAAAPKGRAVASDPLLAQMADQLDEVESAVRQAIRDVSDLDRRN